jgi:hypothetical protein
MKRLFASLLVGAALLVLAGCPTNPSVPAGGTAATVVTPQSPTQMVYAAEVSLTTATNALADLHNAGVVTGDNYIMAKSIELRAHATLLQARAAATAKDATKTQVLINTVIGLIDQIAIYNGGKK